MKDVKFCFDEDGSIDDESIEEFTDIHQTRGYFELHESEVGVTVNIYFDTQIPYILTGNITNVENDGVEITPMNEEIKDVPLYIDFKYQGLDLMINRIEAKDVLTKRRDDNDVNLEEDEEVTHDSDKDSDVDDDDEREEYEEMSVSQLQCYDNDADQFVYNVDQQINDFIDEFLYGKPELKEINLD